jgi:hypothetical protein
MMDVEDVRCMLFNHNTLGVWRLSLYRRSSLSRLCCCCCIMAGNTHTLFLFVLDLLLVGGIYVQGKHYGQCKCKFTLKVNVKCKFVN